MYYELLYGATPWDASSEKELLNRITHVPLSFPKHIPVTEESKDFIRRCL